MADMQDSEMVDAGSVDGNLQSQAQLLREEELDKK